MTWKEFKDIVDKEVRDDEEIWYIDVHFPAVDKFDSGMVEVRHDDVMGVSVG